MALMAHQTIPGTAFVIGQPIHDQATIDEIRANPDLAKHFTNVPDGVFPAPALAAPATKAAVSAPAPVSTPPAAN